MRHGSGPNQSGPQFAPHFNSCAEVGWSGDTPISTITAYTAMFIPTNVVVMGCLFAIISAQRLASRFLLSKVTNTLTEAFKTPTRYFTYTTLGSRATIPPIEARVMHF